MELLQKDVAVATVMNTILMIVGTGAALAYYLSLSMYASTQGFALFAGSYIGFIILMYYYYDRRRYGNVR